MPSELLKIIFKKNEVDFRCVDLRPPGKNKAVEIDKQSKIDYSVLMSGSEVYIALNPATRQFDLSRFNKIIGKKSSLVIKNLENKISSKLIKLTSHNFNKLVHIYIDEALEYQDELFVVDEVENEAYSLDVLELQKLSSNELIGISFSEEIEVDMNIKEKVSFKERVKALHSLPPMPETSIQFLNLRYNPEVGVDEIVAVIEKDPMLVTQIISYANSAFFGQAGSVRSLKDAIFRVLGVDAVMNMALALSVGSVFKMPKSGLVGSKAIWKSSVYTASLMQRLSMLMPWGIRPNPGTSYLVGLLHDIGLLVLGHLFPLEYIELNEYLEKNNDADIFAAEEHVLGINHLEVGKMVMRMWNMPNELVTVTENVNNKKHSSEHEKYTGLLVLVKTLLTPHGLSFGNYSEEIPLGILADLGLEEEDVIIATDEVLSEGEIIKKIVQQMCA